MVANSDGAPHLIITPPTASLPPSSPTPSSSGHHHPTPDSDDLSAQSPVFQPSVDLPPSSHSPSLHLPAPGGAHHRSLSVSSPSSPLRPATPLLNAGHPLPMPLYASDDEVDNTVASVTALLVAEDVKHQMHAAPPPPSALLPPLHSLLLLPLPLPPPLSPPRLLPRSLHRQPRRRLPPQRPDGRCPSQGTRRPRGRRHLTRVLHRAALPPPAPSRPSCATLAAPLLDPPHPHPLRLRTPTGPAPVRAPPRSRSCWTCP